MTMTRPNDGEDATLRIYAWLGYDHEGIEGICLAPSRAGGLLPLVTTDRAQALRMTKTAYVVARSNCLLVRLVQFERGMTLRVVDAR